jgi:6-phosphogluconolactonase (cycloisomerase 2 family)
MEFHWAVRDCCERPHQANPYQGGREQRMGINLRFLAVFIVAVALLQLSSCSSTSSSTAGTGALFVTTQGDSLVTPFSINLGTGVLAANGNGAATGAFPGAAVLDSSGKTLFVANMNSAIPAGSSCELPNPGSISAYSVNQDGTLSAASGNATPAGIIPMAVAVDANGHFFVTNQGLQCDATSGTIAVFSVSGTSLTPISSITAVGAPGDLEDPGPAGLAVTPDGKFLYVANRFDGSVTQYSVDASSGALAAVQNYAVGTAPIGLAVTPDGGFLYAANSGANSNSISAFAICNQVVTSCVNPTQPDGTLTPVSGSPFAAGLGPVAMVVVPSGKFLFVADQQSNQISEFKISTGTGVLAANSQTTISTGANPAWLAFRVGTSTISTTSGTLDFLYVANLGSSTISAFSFDSTVGVLGQVRAPVSTGGQPSAIATE